MAQPFSFWQRPFQARASMVRVKGKPSVGGSTIDLLCFVCLFGEFMVVFPAWTENYERWILMIFGGHFYDNDCPILVD
jgi:hypothetical protein